MLDKTEFRNVEKIKTIGATFMAASGLNPNIREENHHKYQHLRELMDFAYSLQNSVEDFNQSLIEFDLVLRIGFNYGDITSGVIGTTKLYYDIWGDAVNIASRMDSCGVDGRIQVKIGLMSVSMSVVFDYPFQRTIQLNLCIPKDYLLSYRPKGLDKEQQFLLTFTLAVLQLQNATMRTIAIYLNPNFDIWLIFFIRSMKGPDAS